jgi:hypothetical protein
MSSGKEWAWLLKIAYASDVGGLGRREPQAQGRHSVSTKCHCGSMNIKRGILNPSEPEGYIFAGSA